MAYTTIPKSTNYFDTKLWTGNNTAQTITGIPFAPDFVWIKNRSAAESHTLVNTSVGANNFLKSNATSANNTNTEFVKSFTSDGYTLGSADEVNNGSNNIVGWNWKANGAGSANTDGDINSTVSANTTSGFSIVNYTGTLSGSGNPTVGHGLGVAPAVIIIKSASNGENWGVQHTSLPANYLLQLNTTSAQINSASQGTLTAPTSSVFTVNYSGEWGNSGQNYIAYCFANVQGYSKFGSYVGNGNADGSFIYTGFKPGWLLIKESSGAGNDWRLYDSKRLGYNPNNNQINVNTSNSEYSATQIDLLSNGFKLKATDGGLNGSGATYIYMAFAEEPLVSTNGIPATAR